MLGKSLLYLVTADWYFALHHLPLAQAARDAGYRVTVATNADRHGDAITDAGLNLAPIAFSRSGLNPARETATLARLIKLYRDLSPDIAHHLALKPIVYGGMAAHAAGTPAVVNGVMGLGYVFTSQTARARVLRPALTWALRRTLNAGNGITLVQNRDDFTELADRKLAPPSRLRLVRGAGADLDRFAPTPEPEGPPMVVLPARLLGDKGVREFIAAARQLKAKGVVGRFVLVGDVDPSNPASLTAQEIAETVAVGTIEHWGWRTDMPSIYAQAHVVCLPSYREGLPTTLLEAAASQRAIVTTDVPGCREIVTAGRSGWLVPPRDADALAQALYQAITHAGQRASFAAAARHDVMRDFSPRAAIDQVLRVYADQIAATAHAP